MDHLVEKTFLQTIPNQFREELQLIAAAQTVEEGAILFMDGEKAENLYFILSGKVKISKTTMEGKELTLYICQPGELIGELALFQTDISYTSTAEMMESGVIGTIPRITLEELLSKNGPLAVEFMKWMGIAYRRNQSKFRDLMLHGKHGALYSTLIRMTNSYGKKTNDGILIDLPLTNKDLANFIGTSRESVNRMLSELRKDNVITIDGGYITIHRLEYLKLYLECDECSDDICRI